MKTVKIIASEHDGIDIRAMSLSLEILDGSLDNEDAIREAIYAACDEFCKTKEGHEVYIGNCSGFNWGDLDTYVPNEICEKHGFRKIDENYDLLFDVIFDEQLVNENEINEYFDETE